MQLTFASYNIHKGVGLDRRRDPERILSVLHEIDADIIALQEADRRIGERASVLPRADIDDTRWRVIEVARRPRSIGWHGNALLVRRGIDIVSGEALDLPTIEPRGAACGEIVVEGHSLRVIGTHLDLSGLRRRDQIRSLLGFCNACDRNLPTVIMGDFNQWGRQTGAMREFAQGWHIVTPGRSYPSRQPVATLDRIVASTHWNVVSSDVHHTALSTVASDHLPVKAVLSLIKK
ncbi:endonuclease/exonuclease/phosphatase family protein [Qipengyuania sp. NPDC077410]|uniref:endonuclease/exonuclease/phosphatase family protein n=1 Tax=Qipengyuania sp. NPDC077410 TaxID=3364496 RepID=UPI0037C810A3